LYYIFTGPETFSQALVGTIEGLPQLVTKLRNLFIVKAGLLVIRQ
jgi:hypothetical protein